MFLFNAIVLFMLWVLLSGRFDAFHLTLGVLASLFVAFNSYDLMYENNDRRLKEWVRLLCRFPGYALWLTYQIALANLYVLYLAFHPRVKETIDPEIVRFKTILKSRFAKFVFATSITLTPGTVTIRIKEDEFLVHAITSKLAASLPGDMEKKVAKAFDYKTREPK